MDFNVNSVEVGTRASEVKLAGKATVHAAVKVAAYLNPTPQNADSIPSGRGHQFCIKHISPPAAPSLMPNPTQSCALHEGAFGTVRSK